MQTDLRIDLLEWCDATITIRIK